MPGYTSYVDVFLDVGCFAWLRFCADCLLVLAAKLRVAALYAWVLVDSGLVVCGCYCIYWYAFWCYFTLVVATGPLSLGVAGLLAFGSAGCCSGVAGPFHAGCHELGLARPTS
ncbi:hypothetical protein U1Q18_033714 [Sarracenia purpurea var. burkii]